MATTLRVAVPNKGPLRIRGRDPRRSRLPQAAHRPPGKDLTVLDPVNGVEFSSCGPRTSRDLRVQASSTSVSPAAIWPLSPVRRFASGWPWDSGPPACYAVPDRRNGPQRTWLESGSQRHIRILCEKIWRTKD